MGMLLDFPKIFRKYDLKITGVIHIGAHHGSEVPDYISHGIQNITLFEPLSKNFDVLEKRLADANANIKAYQVALGSEEKIATMYLSDNDLMSSSILKPKNHITEMPWVYFEGTEEVEVKLLDSFDVQNANFINIDVQGYELEVFKGAKKTLERIDYIYSEVNRGQLYDGNVMIDELDDFLGQYKFERVETYWPETWYNWGDAFYIKRK
jgi:FkbM family methyltransferase